MTTYMNNPFVIRDTFRRYNPKTSRYESIVTKKPDPWEGAPKGIRVEWLGGGSNPTPRRVLNEQGENYLIHPKPYMPAGMDLPEIVKAFRLMSSCWKFVDFDGAPEGQRFYVRWRYLNERDWEPRVATPDGVYSKNLGHWSFVGNSRIKDTAWYERNDNWDVILVDPAPEEPKVIPSERFFYYDLVGRGDKLNADEVRQAHLVIAVNEAGKVRVEKSRHFAQPVN